MGRSYIHEDDEDEEELYPATRKPKIKTKKVVKDYPPLIVGINGIAGAGKDTITDMVILALAKDHKIKSGKFAFADNLKRAASAIFGIELDDFYNRDLKEVKDPYWDMSPREMAQKLGTEACRKGIRDDIWIRSLATSINNSFVDLAFITDVRFDNEAEFVRESGGIVINITRDSQTKIATSNHASEAGISDHLIDYKVINITGNTFIGAGSLQQVVLDFYKSKTKDQD